MTPDDISAHISALKRRAGEIDSKLAAPDIYSRRAEFTALSREKSRLDRIFALHDAWTKALRETADNTALLQTEQDPSFRDLINADLEKLRTESAEAEQNLMFALIPPDRADTRNTIMEIRPAAGGEEAALFAGEIFRMYCHYAERKGWKCEVLSLSESELGGVKEAVFSLSGSDVFSYMKFESGVHRVQRVPATEASGRIHTSTITVAVLPEADELDDIEIRHEDLEISTFRSSGPGGQNVNRTDSAVRILHKPTGIVVASQQERSQIRNREICMRILTAKLLEIRNAEEAAKQAANKRSQIGTGDRSERIRTYNFPQNRVTDHRYGVSAFDLPGLMEGNLDMILDKIRGIERENAVRSLLEHLR